MWLLLARLSLLYMSLACILWSTICLLLSRAKEDLLLFHLLLLFWLSLSLLACPVFLCRGSRSPPQLQSTSTSKCLAESCTPPPSRAAGMQWHPSRCLGERTYTSDATLLQLVDLVDLH